ncbi:MAG TPA: TspO/MBR family protein [Schlesneria sp.]
MPWMDWYNHLAKPAWTPSPSTISLIWTLLYPVIFMTFGFVFVQVVRRKVATSVLWPFAINLVANLLFMPIFVGLQNIQLAALDIIVVWTTIIWCMVVIWPFYRWVALAQIPYFLWVATATILQLSIVMMNRMTT